LDRESASLPGLLDLTADSSASGLCPLDAVQNFELDIRLRRETARRIVWGSFFHAIVIALFSVQSGFARQPAAWSFVIGAAVLGMLRNVLARRVALSAAAAGGKAATWLLLTSGIQGAIWGAFLFYAFSFVRGQVVLECLLVVAVAGISSTSASLYAPVPRMAYLQSAFQIIPACVWSVYVEPRYGWLLVALVFSFAACAPAVIRVHARSIREAFRNQLMLEAQSAELQRQMREKDAAHAALAKAQNRLIEFSRFSGMAEIATGVLHNVGNVLNSVNVSATLVAEKAESMNGENLAAAVGLLQAHQGELSEFLENDPKGRRLLPYLAHFAANLEQKRDGLLEEIALLRKHVEHIRQIVATQQNYACVAGNHEPVSLVQLVEDAFRIAQPGYDRNSITMVREFEDLPPIPVDKHQVLQILLNLLRNAQRATQDGGDCRKAVVVRIQRRGADRVRIEVADSGVGIIRENLTRVFAHGFTTKRDGHGFGLHSGSLAAQRMGGSLWAESAGEGQGATFVLELPAVFPDQSDVDSAA
jgi:signal transduction histidine kinase